MATITYFTDTTPTVVDLTGRVVKAERVIDFSLCGASSAGDTVRLLNIPAGAHVMSVGVDIITPEGSALTMTIGDTVGTEWLAFSSGTGIDLGASPCTVPTYNSIPGTAYADTNAALGGKFYTTDTYLIGVLSAYAAKVAKFTVWAEYALIANFV